MFQRQRLINSRAYTNGESEVAIKIPIKHALENGTGPSNSTERGVNGTRRDEDMAEAGNETENEDNENNENDEEEEEEEDDNDGPYTPFDLPCKKLLGFPCFSITLKTPNSMTVTFEILAASLITPSF